MTAQRPARRRLNATLPLGLACAACLWATAPASAEGPIKRWVDERGMVHYSDALPAQPVRNVITLPEAPQPSAAELARSQAELSRYRQTGQAPAASASAPGQPAAASAPATAAKTPAAPEGPLSCSQQWQRFDQAYRCMDAYRVSGGGIKEGGFAACPVVGEPGCSRP